MRAWVLAALALGGCATKNVCDGISGTCVDLTVDSKSVTRIDELHIVASGALSGTQDTSGHSTSLPLHVAMRFPSGASGNLHLDVAGSASGTVVGSGSTDLVLIAGKHGTAEVMLAGGNSDLGVIDSGVADLANTADAAMPPCDPAGMTGPQCVWRWQTPQPQGDDLVGVVSFADADTFAISKDGLMLHRDGTAWSVLSTRPPGKSGARGMFGAGTHLFVTSTIYTTTTKPVVFHSSDKGTTWAQETLPAAATGFPYAGTTDGSNAIIGGESGAMYVRDPTGTWSTKSTGGTVTLGGVSMLFGNAVAVGYDSSAANKGIAYSSDMGNTWTLATSITPASPLLQSSCIGRGLNQPQYWAVGNGVILHASGPTPSTWTQQGSAATANLPLSGCVALDDMHVWAWGSNGVVLVTTDGGTNWATVTTPPATTLTLQAGAHSPSGVALTVVGEKGALYRSTDGNTFVSEQHGPQDALSSVFGVAQGKLFAVGDNGAIYRTSDGGTTWIKLAIPAESGTTASLTSIWAASPTDIYAVGAGVIVHSSDGMTFQKYGGILPATTVLADVWGGTNGVFAAGQSGSGATQQRVLLRTTNQGAAWSAVTISGYTDTMGAGFSAQTTFTLGSDTWVSGDGCLIYHSTDGTTFAQQSTGTCNAAVTRLRGVSGHLLAGLGTDPGQMIESINGGMTWTALSSAIFGAAVYRIAFTPNQSSIFVIGPTSGANVSTDKGATWVPLYTGIIDETNAITDFFPFADNDVYIVSDRGIVHYGN